jgi:release factor glutamine methyltransferase
MRGVTVMDGVYPPSEDSYLLIDAVAPLTSPGTVLELCCGTGVVGLSLANKARHVVAIDLNPVAIRNTIVNYRNSSLLEKLDAVVGDLFTPLRGRTFDLVIMNPPYIDDDGKANDLSWSGGEKGRQVIDRFLDAVGALLKPGGWAVFIQSDLNGIQETVKRARSNGMKARVIREKVFRFETLLAMEVRLQ